MNPVHAPRSPSKRARFSRCPGSVAFPDSEDSGPAAIDGTHSHTLLEKCIKGGLADPLATVGSTFEDHDGQFTVDSERAQRVKIAVDYIRARALMLSGMCEISAETRADPARLVGRDDMSGTYDAAIVGGGVYELIDYKDGMHAVSAENNEQLEQYAVGVLAEYPVRPYPFVEMWLTIIQPKLAAKGMPTISTWKTTVDDIMGRVVPQLQKEAAACDDPNAPRIPGDVQCRYCPGKGSCPELAAHALASAGISFPSVEPPSAVRILPESGTVANVPAVEVFSQAAAANPATMSPEQIVQVLEAAPLIRSMLEAMDKEALKRLQANPNAFGGKLKLVAGKGSRKWALPEDQMEAVLKKFGVPKSAIWKTEMISPAQAEKVVWQNKAGETITLNEKKQKKLQAEYVTKIGGKPCVALASDDRPSLVTDASALFGAVDAAPAPAAPASAPEALPSWLM